MLEEFWVVTKTSIYHVVSKGPDGHPAARKIALRGISEIPVGDKLEGGTMIGICTFLLAFIDEKYGWLSPLTGFEREPGEVSKQWWGERTSPIVGLFLSEDEARKCFEEKNLRPRDPRWIEQTKTVVQAIGNEHPAFVISQTKGLRLFEPGEISP
ncbi:MAG: hypothetical protein HYS52_00485 [Candidatus Wildermuthbacteria bacterium]|nr:hypothetical protein [Candidatus Wildermuthbacteria bacterium]